jgi:HPr kinase/phosphorylase
MLIHASCVAIGGRGILLAGSEPGGKGTSAASGIGKSDLALRLIDSGAMLVADDQCLLALANDAVTASAPAAIAGLIEVRHIGPLRLPFLASAAIVLYVELVPREAPHAILERMPEPDSVFLLDRPVRRLRLAAFDVSTPAKIRASLAFGSVS